MPSSPYSPPPSPPPPNPRPPREEAPASFVVKITVAVDDTSVANTSSYAFGEALFGAATEQVPDADRANAQVAIQVTGTWMVASDVGSLDLSTTSDRTTLVALIKTAASEQIVGDVNVTIDDVSSGRRLAAQTTQLTVTRVYDHQQSPGAALSLEAQLTVALASCSGNIVGIQQTALDAVATVTVVGTPALSTTDDAFQLANILNDELAQRLPHILLNVSPAVTVTPSLPASPSPSPPNVTQPNATDANDSGGSTAHSTIVALAIAACLVVGILALLGTLLYRNIKSVDKDMMRGKSLRIAPICADTEISYGHVPSTASAEEPEARLSPGMAMAWLSRLLGRRSSSKVLPPPSRPTLIRPPEDINEARDASDANADSVPDRAREEAGEPQTREDKITPFGDGYMVPTSRPPSREAWLSPKSSGTAATADVVRQSKSLEDDSASGMHLDLSHVDGSSVVKLQAMLRGRLQRIHDSKEAAATRVVMAETRVVAALKGRAQRKQYANKKAATAIQAQVRRMLAWQKERERMAEMGGPIHARVPWGPVLVGAGIGIVKSERGACSALSP